MCVCECTKQCKSSDLSKLRLDSKQNTFNWVSIQSWQLFFGHIFFCKLQTLLQTCMVLFSMLSNISYHSCFIQLFLFRSSTFCSYFVIVLPVRMWSVNDILHLWVFEYFVPFFHCFSPWITKMGGGKSLKCNEFKNDSDDDNKECEYRGSRSIYSQLK